MLQSNLKVYSALFLYFQSDLWKKIILFFFFLWIAVDFELALTILQNRSGYGSTEIINNKISFSEVCLSGIIRLTGKFAFEF